MVIAVIKDHREKPEVREYCFCFRLGMLDEGVSVEAELDAENRFRLLLFKYTNTVWDETRHLTEYFMDGDEGFRLASPLFFCLTRKQREALADLMEKEQYYGMTGKEMLLRFFEWSCSRRGIPFRGIFIPEWDSLPILEDGARGVYDKWYYGPEDERHEFLLLKKPLGGNAFAHLVANQNGKPEPVYLKILEMKQAPCGVEMTLNREDGPITYTDYRIDPQDDVRRWCRISIYGEAHYITGMDECMMLTASQRDALQEAVLFDWKEIVEDVDRLIELDRLKLERLYNEGPVPDYSMLPVWEEEQNARNNI